MQQYLGLVMANKLSTLAVLLALYIVAKVWFSRELGCLKAARTVLTG